MKDKILSIALSVLLSSACLSPLADSLPAKAVPSWSISSNYEVYEEPETEHGSLKYYIFSDHAVLVCADWDTSELIIPESVNGVPVTVITDDAFRDQVPKHISIPSTIEDLGSSLGELESDVTIELSPENKNYINKDNVIYTSDMEKLVRVSPRFDKEEFTIPDTVITVCGKAFNRCRKIKTVNVPASVATIGDETFEGCSLLEAINVDEGNTFYISKDGVLFDKSMTELYQYPAGSKNTSYTVPDSVTRICTSAFVNCDGLRTVDFGNSLEIIENSAFANCDNLNDIVFPESTREISFNAFEGCSRLSKITFSDNIEKVEATSFSSTPWFNAQPDGVIYIGKVLYKVKGKLAQRSVVTVREGTVSIADCAFCTEDSEYGPNDSGDKNLVFVKLPDSLEDIGNEAFKGCSSLVEIALPDGIKNIGNAAFEGCSSLKFIHIPKSLRGIEYSAFASCSSLTEVVIPENVTYVFINAFGNCTSLKKITFENELCTIDDPFGMEEPLFSKDNEDFSGTVCGYEYSTAQDFALNNGYSFASLGIKANNESPAPGDPVSDDTWAWFDMGDHAEIFEYYGKSDVLDIPDELGGLPVTAIYESFYAEKDNIRSVKIPAGLTELGALKFNLDNVTDIEIDKDNKSFVIENGILYGANMTELIRCIPGMVKGELTIPDSVITADHRAFIGCSEITVINVPAATTDLYCDFSDCTSLEAVNAAPKNVSYSSIDGILFNDFKDKLYLYPQNHEGTSYTVPNRVTEICSESFYNCDRLESVTLPSSTTSILNAAFMDCDKLDNVVIPNSVYLIEDLAFYSCDNLKDITFSNNINYFGNQVMEDTPWLETQPDGPVYCGPALYTVKGGTEDVTVKDGTKCIANYAFTSTEHGEYSGSSVTGNNTLKSVTIPDSVESIGLMAFAGCSALTEVKLPKSAKMVGFAMFSGCTSLKDIVLTDKDPRIPPSEYRGCDSLTDVVIPENITFIDSYAFAECASLRSVTIRNPDCVIDSNPANICNSIVYPDDEEEETIITFTGTIYGYEGSPAEAYAKANGYKFSPITEAPRMTGDINNDGRINAVDASAVLSYYAMVSTSQDGGFTEAQKQAAEVNNDSTINAVDASGILAYYAYTSTASGEVISIEDFISQMRS